MQYVAIHEHIPLNSPPQPPDAGASQHGMEHNLLWPGSDAVHRQSASRYGVRDDKAEPFPPEWRVFTFAIDAAWNQDPLAQPAHAHGRDALTWLRSWG